MGDEMTKDWRKFKETIERDPAYAIESFAVAVALRAGMQLRAKELTRAEPGS